MNATVVGLVTPHLLRIVDLANEAQRGVNVDWHLRDSVARTMRELADQYNAQALVTAFVDGLEAVAGQAPRAHTAYIGALQSAAASARNLWRD